MDKKISELDQALQINNDAVFPISQDNGGTDTTYKVSITQISAEIGEDQTFSNLDTTDKTLVGAINEVAQGGGGGGSSTLAGLSDVDIDDQTLSDGQVLKYDSVEEKWVNDDVGAGGHTIVADDGTDLAQRANLQFIGAYSEDNSVDDTTEVNVVREMTKADFDQLTEAEKTGLINVTDEHDSANKNYSETTLWSGSETPTTSGTDITLTDDIANYDEIVFYVISESGRKSQESFFVSGLSIGETYLEETYPPESIGVFWVYTSGTSIKIYRISSSSENAITYTKVVGIKYGNGTKTFHNYSMAEQVVGTWIDGSTIYEKTLNVGTISTETTVAHGIDNLDTIIDYSGFGKYAGTDKAVIPFQNPASGYGFGINAYNGTNLIVARSSFLGSNISDCYITLRYTKSV